MSAPPLVVVTRHSSVRFLVVGGVSFVTDAGLLYALHAVMGVPLLPATVAAYTACLAVNFALNRLWVFEERSRIFARLARYFVLVGINYVSTVALMGGLTRAGLHFLSAKTISTIVIAVTNYFAYRRWVFR